MSLYRATIKAIHDVTTLVLMMLIVTIGLILSTIVLQQASAQNVTTEGNVTQTLRGLATVNYYAADLNAAKEWYSELLGIEPYFERPDSINPAYIEFRIGDYQHELGIIDSKYAPNNTKPGPGGEIAYWHVDNVTGTLEKLKAMGAREYEPATEHGAGFVTASVVDPFGNILGIMYNQHFLDILTSTKAEN